MKKENILRKLLFALTFPAMIVACDNEDEPAALSVDFSSLATTVAEAEAPTITIPLRNASNVADKLSVEFGGSAVEGEDFTFVGLTDEGVQLTILDDDDAEFDEIIRVRLVSSSINLNGNNTHEVTIQSNCADSDKPFVQFFRGLYHATEKYGPNPPAANWYGPYELVLEPDPDHADRLIMHNFYDSGREAYLQFDVATGKVWFPDQTPLPDSSPNLITESTGTFTVDECNHTTLTIELNYDGGVWEYYFEKQ